MADQEQDAKGAEEAGGEPSTPHLDMEHFDDNSDNLIETITDDTDEVGGVDLSSGGARTEPAKDDGVKPDKPEEKTTDKVETKVDAEPDADKGKKAEPYHKDPAWQRIIKERDDALKTADSLTSRVDALEKGPAKTDSKIIDIDTLTDEEIAEWQNDDPKGYANNLKLLVTSQVRESVKSELAAETEQQKMDKTFDSYSSDNPDTEDGTGFVQMWESGKIRTYIEQNPGHNAISAHMKLTEDSKTLSRQEAIDKGIAEGVAKEKARLAAENKARMRTTGLGQGPAYSPTTDESELKDTKKKGGLTTVLADRLRKRRQQASA